ncbi:beta-propeller fold lactonase family protein [Shewanella eurypsychrophilus]|uniref:Beta-propeller fold lactonase family protein n=1 Tax=Shewanella eurypsychrophilus TaxID=2593656 RepID=A0ABX6V8I6_9GAMM|nr:MULTISPECIES: beta-propeller fold lactonase family protein [Shewanella]QFU23615.1 beta-propeller fold lactonase family protein [Shewanella sp. YLB-09]QPG58838.1 beta-propeller fold lactonase family protein [Shewanella eurypsychrophilus]
MSQTTSIQRLIQQPVNPSVQQLLKKVSQRLCAVLLLGPLFFVINHTQAEQLGDPVEGKNKAVLCAGCHGLDGIGLSSEYPNLAGQKQAYIIKQLEAFKLGHRQEATMQAMASSLSGDDTVNLAAYYSQLTISTSAQISQPVSEISQSTPSLACSMANFEATQAEFPETIFVTMKGCGAIETFPSMSTWEGGPNMLYTAISPDGKHLFSTSPSSGKLYVFNVKTGKKVAIIPVGKAPKGVKVHPDGKQVYVSNEASSTISIIDIASMSVIHTIAVPKAPHNVRFTEDGSLAYVTLQGGAGIGVIDTAQQKMVKVIPIPGITGPHNLDLSKDEKIAYVRDFVQNVAVVELATAKVLNVIKVGNGHGGIDVAPDGSFVATAAIGDNKISIIDTVSLTTQHLVVGEGPHGIRASKNSQWIYVTLTKDNQVLVINAKTLAIEKQFPVGNFPFWIAVNGNP